MGLLQSAAPKHQAGPPRSIPVEMFDWFATKLQSLGLGYGHLLATKGDEGLVQPELREMQEVAGKAQTTVR